MAKSKLEPAGEKVTQKDMVLAAIQELGWDAGPRELQGAIQSRFQYEMPVNYISNYKSQLKKKGGGVGAGKRGRKAGMQFTDLETVRGLVNRLGADQVKSLVEMADMFA